MSKMHAGIQQFLNTNTNHKFPLVGSPPISANHPAEHGIDFSVVMAAGATSAQVIYSRFFFNQG